MSDLTATTLTQLTIYEAETYDIARIFNFLNTFKGFLSFSFVAENDKGEVVRILKLV